MWQSQLQHRDFFLLCPNRNTAGMSIKNKECGYYNAGTRTMHDGEMQEHVWVFVVLGDLTGVTA
jgi:hypothetical protein